MRANQECSMRAFISLVVIFSDGTQSPEWVRSVKLGIYDINTLFLTISWSQIIQESVLPWF